MGQYYMAILGDSHGLNCKVFDRSVEGEYMLAKLMEHSWWQNSFCNSFAERIYKTKKRVCWVGDYANDDDFHFKNSSAFYTPSYKEIWGDSVKTLTSSATDFTLDHKFLLNHDTKEYVDLDEYKEKSIDKDGWVIHPLPLLTAVGNDRGSGDFHNGNIGYEFVGSWAWHLISISDKPPKSYKKFELAFKEERGDEYEAA